MIGEILDALDINLFFVTYFDKLWILLLLIACGAAIFIFYDSSRRNIQDSRFWKIASLVNLALLIPTIVVAFNLAMSILGTDWDLLNLFAYLGLAAGILGAALAISYGIRFKGVQESYQGDGYDEVPFIPNPYPNPAPVNKPQGGGYKPSKPKANAWIILKSNGKNHQLNKGTTIIGRSSHADIQIVSDGTVSAQHIKIVEENEHYTMIDLGSTNGTWVNGFRVRQPVLLDINDEIRLGDNTYFKFIA